MSKILVTGSEGFIGKHLVKALEHRGHEVLKFDFALGQDITKVEHFEGIAKIDVVFHLAAIAFVPEANEHPQKTFSVNTEGTKNVCELCKRNSATLIFASSYLYGKPQKLPIDEHHPIDTFNAYAKSKYDAEKVIQGYEQEGLVAVKLRFFNIYGPGQRREFLISKIMHQLQEGKIELFDAKPKRDFTYVTDAVESYLAAMSYDKNGIFNIGSGKSYSVEQIVAMILKIYGKDVPVLYTDKVRKNEVDDCYCDNALAKKELGWEPSVSIEEGLKKTLVGEGI